MRPRHFFKGGIVEKYRTEKPALTPEQLTTFFIPEDSQVGSPNIVIICPEEIMDLVLYRMEINPSSPERKFVIAFDDKARVTLDQFSEATLREYRHADVVFNPEKDAISQLGDIDFQTVSVKQYSRIHGDEKFSMPKIQQLKTLTVDGIRAPDGKSLAAVVVFVGCCGSIDTFDVSLTELKSNHMNVEYGFALVE